MYKVSDPMAGPPQLGRHPTESHRGRAEIQAFMQRFVDMKIEMVVEDVLVNGPPWNLRIAARVHHWIVIPNGEDIYTNRAVLFATSRWGRIVEQEDYEDTTRVADFDDYLSRQPDV